VNPIVQRCGANCSTPSVPPLQVAGWCSVLIHANMVLVEPIGKKHLPDYGG